MQQGSRLATRMAWIEYRLYKIENFLCSLSLMVMLLMIFLSVCVRYFNLPLPNVSEWALVAMAPLTFVGAAMCTKLGQHIAVDFVHQSRSMTLRKCAHLLVSLLLLLFSGIYTWLGLMLLDDAISSGETMIDLGTPVAIPVFCYFLGMLLMSIHALCQLIRAATFNALPDLATTGRE